ncbi:IclR family transcriptional regulator (plasmid) [Cellulomonas sp. WB94]|uniref:IclR family transcriptional regulator n=1 Tax=Cellulomonas sp. WB94 TaxID=2173174 RepID=UPI000D5829F3|nr:IclR family transcriptional regulator [Cellulomonas sp. WB94]PVU84369.1 IclR family transcriptional regulator [Cellulomonas sp. WB94]
MAESSHGSTSPVESVDRALLVLDALARAGATGVGLAELAAALDLNKSTLHRALAALSFRGFVTQDRSSGAYLLGPSAIQLAERYFGDENLAVMLHPALVALCGAVDELVHLGVLSGTQVIYLDKVEPERSVRVWSAVGRRRQAISTALGRALLAYRGTDRRALAGYLVAADGGVTDDASADRAWLAMQRAVERGYAIEAQENEPGISCIAVPLLRQGAAIGAVSITAPAERMDAERITWLHEQMTRVLPPLLPATLSLP